MRITLWPDALAKAKTRVVLPTPGLPSKRRALAGNCIALSKRFKLDAGVGASKIKLVFVRESINGPKINEITI